MELQEGMRETPLSLIKRQPSSVKKNQKIDNLGIIEFKLDMQMPQIEEKKKSQKKNKERKLPKILITEVDFDSIQE